MYYTYVICTLKCPLCVCAGRLPLTTRPRSLIIQSGEQENGPQSFQSKTKAFRVGLPSPSPGQISSVVKLPHCPSQASSTVSQHALITLFGPTWCEGQLERVESHSKDVTSLSKNGGFFHQCIFLIEDYESFFQIVVGLSVGNCSAGRASSNLLGFAPLRTKIRTLLRRWRKNTL